MKEKLKSITVEKYIAAVMFLVLAALPAFPGLYTTQIMGKFLTYMMLALALDILWGYGGLMDLGFGVFFGLGGYVFGISMTCRQGLPAFMSSGGLTELPWFYVPLKSTPVAVLFWRCSSVTLFSPARSRVYFST